MTDSNVPEALPRLAVGSHDRGSGKACIMNAISYLNGDTQITDHPDCTFPLLASVAISLNDSLCTHKKKDLICSSCSHVLWLLSARILGTAEAVQGWSEQEIKMLNVRLAIFAAKQVLNLVRPEDMAVCVTALNAAENWCDRPSKAAGAAAEAAWAAAGAAGAAAEAAAGAAAWAAAGAAGAAGAAAWAAAEAAAWAAAEAAGNVKVELAHKLIDEFERLTSTVNSKQWTEEDFAKVRLEARL